VRRLPYFHFYEWITFFFFSLAPQCKAGLFPQSGRAGSFIRYSPLPQNPSSQLGGEQVFVFQSPPFFSPTKAPSFTFPLITLTSLQNGRLKELPRPEALRFSLPPFFRLPVFLFLFFMLLGSYPVTPFSSFSNF